MLTEIYTKAAFTLTRLLLFLLLSIGIFNTSFAQEKKKDVTTPETPKEKILEKKLENKPYSIRQFFHETILFVKQPTKWKGKDWIRVGAVTLSTLAVMPFDERITNLTQGQQRYFYSVPIEGGRIYGEWYAIGGVAGAFALYGWIAKDTGAKKIAIELLQGGLYSELVTTVLKISIGRARPEFTSNAFTYHPFTVGNYNFQSLPSGHTTSAFALSTIMSRHAKSTSLKILAYVPAAFTMFSRIYQHHHWLSDEVVAAAIGYFAGNWVVDLHEGKRHRINVSSVLPPTISFNFDKRHLPIKSVLIF